MHSASLHLPRVSLKQTSLDPSLFTHIDRLGISPYLSVSDALTVAALPRPRGRLRPIPTISRFQLQCIS